MSQSDMEPIERQADCEQAGQADMLQALRSASLPDEFWMYSYKILPCPHGYRHSWTHCPFSHTGETARRRCPRTFSYLPDPCINARAKRQCPNGDACPYAHNTFEQWLHPARYRTRLCYLGANCRRPTCFFAHSVEELRSVEENESAAAPLPQQPLLPSALMPPALPPLPMPPPLSPSSSSGIMSASGNSGEYAPLTPALPLAGSSSATAASGGPAVPAVHHGTPLGLLQPVVLMGIPPQAHQGLRPDMLAPPGTAVHCFMPYQARPAMLHPAMPMPSTSTSLSGEPGAPAHHIHVPPPGPAQLTAVPITVRPPPPHIAAPTAAMAVAAVHHPGSIHMAPAGAVFLHGSMPPPPPPPAGAPTNGPPPPPPQTFCSPFVTPGGYYRTSEGVPPSGPPPVAAGRARSYSNPGETVYRVSAAPGGSGTRMYGNGSEQLPAWASSVDAGRRAATDFPSSGAAASGPLQRVALTASGGGRGSSAAAAAAAPRHMPAPTNRSGAVRRLSTPVDTSTSVSTAATSTVQSRNHPESAESSPPLLRMSGSVQNPSRRQQQQQLYRTSIGGVDAALQNMSLPKPFAAPPPTPAMLRASNSVGGAVRAAASGSPYSLSPSASASSPQSAALASTVGSPSAAMVLSCDAAVAAAAAAAAAVQTDLAILAVRPSVDGAVGGNAFSRPSSSGSGTSAGAMLSAYDSNAAAAAAALAAVTGGVDDAAAAAMTMAGPYRALLQRVLRSASSTGAVDTPSGLLPTLPGGSSGGATDVDAVHADLYYDEPDVDVLERSSDPGPAGLHAAIRRISSEFGSSAVHRNSDPGHGPSLPPPAETDVQQLLLPLLQTVLTEGLATGQFELVNGQLQLKSGAGVSGGAAAANGRPDTFTVVPSAGSTAMGVSLEPTATAACAGSSGGVVTA